MLSDPKSHRIERFGDRLDWCVKHLQPNTPVAIGSRAYLWECIQHELGPACPGLKTWRRSTGPKDDYAVPDVFIRGILHIYPEVTLEALTAPKFSGFEAYALEISAAHERWNNATMYVARKRDVLAALGKHYHKNVDEEPDFPLIAKKGWLLRHPVLLTEDSPLPKFVTHFKEEDPPRLDGLNVDYVFIKSRFVPRDHQPRNIDGYRLLDVNATRSGLDLTFGSTTYPRYINSCEAAAAELADYALRCSATVAPDMLSLRGPPERVFDLKRRSAFVGVNCLLMLKNYSTGGRSNETTTGRHKFVLQVRGEEVLEAQNTIAVVPSGGHEPLAVGFGDDREATIWRTVVREFCEELFNKEEATKLRSYGEEFLSLPEIRPLVDIFFRTSKFARVYLLGVGLDPVTTKPEILVAIVVDWMSVIKKITLKVEQNYEGKVHLVDLSYKNLLREANAERVEKSLNPAARACLLQAAKHYELLMGES
jgi:hypothetical protein